MNTSIPPEATESTSPTATTKASATKRRKPVPRPKTKLARKATATKKATAPRRGNKTAKVLDLLKRPGGVTLKELAKATGWQAHSVRGFLSGNIGKKMGTSVESSKRADGERAYRISSK